MAFFAHFSSIWSTFAETWGSINARKKKKIVESPTKQDKISITEYDRTYASDTSTKLWKYQRTHDGRNEDDDLEDNTDCSSSGERKLFSIETQVQESGTSIEEKVFFHR